MQEPYAEVPPHLKPTIEWQNVQVANFSKTRMYISRLLSKRSEWPQNVTSIHLDTNDKQQWTKLFKDREPTLSCMLGLSYKILEDGLDLLIHSLNCLQPGETISYKTGLWIYALLACTRQPLLPDTISVFRKLARKCAEIRSRLDPEDESSKEAVVPLNVFICLVGRYFGQYDLAD
ncbi:gem-associated protein 2 isoform X2 [Leptidea sinapis]|uniref:gem-associated protein 2 isoform X2 n=1 Tax=Leptidea sinapis TaxID=189913 RepID=UPI0021C2B532|nr:gem-associated protein 2 isoform X2 [Leptidea sinapis]